MEQRPLFFHGRDRKKQRGSHWKLDPVAGEVGGETKQEREPKHPSSMQGEESREQIEEGKGWEGHSWRRLREVFDGGCLLPPRQDTRTTMITPLPPLQLCGRKASG